MNKMPICITIYAIIELRFTNLPWISGEWEWRPRVLQTQGRQGHKKIASGEGRGEERTEYK